MQNQAEKRHAACDECRTRKLKCSGTLPRCERCQRESVQCVYSAQKQMGRPRKRRRDDADQPVRHPLESAAAHPSLASFSEPSVTGGIVPISPSGSNGIGLLYKTPSEWGTTLSFLNQESLDLLDLQAQESVLPQGIGIGTESTVVPAWTNTGDVQDLSISSTLPPDQFPKLPCPCLSTMYLTLTNLQALTSFAFPSVLPHLRTALQTALAILNCPDCPKESFTAIQNAMTLGALLTAIAERFHRTLRAIDDEAARLERAGLTKEYRMGDMSVETLHLHTGEPGCPMGFEIELAAEDWRKLAKKVVKAEVLGKGKAPNSLVNLVEQMEQRQLKWHTGRVQRGEAFGNCREEGTPHHGGDPICLRMIGGVRVMMDAMNWT